MRRVFILAYYSYLDPVFQSAVLPYFLNFPNKDGYRFTLLTFEQARFRMAPEMHAQVVRELKAHNIDWFCTTWHSGRFKFIKKIFDFSWGICLAAYLILRFRCQLIYSEAFPGAVLGHYLSKLTGCHHVVHSFEPHTDYMVEGGVWRPDAWEARLLRFHEHQIGMQASAILTATQKNIDEWKALGSPADFVRVPSCVDLATFAFDAEARRAIRQRLAVQDTERLLIYLGKFGGMYWDHELFQFFAACYQRSPQIYRFLILSLDDPGRIRQGMLEARIPEDRFHLESASKAEVPGYLSAADMGICAVRQFPSKRYCSPIKDGEYWATGLPVAIPAGVSDDFELTAEHGLGLVITSLTPAGLEEAATRLHDWFESNPVEAVRERTRNFASRDRSVEQYRPVIDAVFSRLLP